jgi:ferric-dicitrate binding protein FerR (iron transport regulator)
MKPSRMIAALLTMMSMPPKHCTAKSTAAAAADGLARLSVKALARGPKRRRRVSRHGGIAAAAVDGGAVVGDHHTGALAVQPLDDGAADAAAATGDQRHAAVERAPHQRTTAAIANARFSASL